MNLVATVLVVVGSAIVTFLGVAHAVFTLQSQPDGGPLTPTNEQTRQAMQFTGGLGMAPHIDSTLWRAWVGFNLSHSLGVFVIGLVIGVPALVDFDAATANIGWVVLALCAGPSYLLLSVRYWFRDPTVGIATATACITAGVVGGVLL